MTDLPFLLQGQGTSYKLPGRSLDFRTRMSDLFGERLGYLSAEAAPVLILTRADDREADAVGLSLATRGVPYLRLDADRLPTATVSLVLRGSYGSTEGSTELSAGFHGREKLDPSVVWLRHFDSPAIPTPQDDDPVVRAFTQGEWYLAVRGLSACASGRWMNHPAAARALDRVTQLRLADSVGLATPETLVSNDPQRIRDFVRLHSEGVIAKTIGEHFVEARPGTLCGVFPRILTEANFPEPRTAALAPCLFQEYVPHTAEVRATVIGERVVAARIVKANPESIWECSGELFVKEHRVPHGLHNALLEYMRAARLEYGAFDLLLGDDERYVFLEVNPEGDWMWLEDRNARIDITEQVSSHIANLIEGSV